MTPSRWLSHKPVSRLGWETEDVEFAKRWIEIVEKFPNKLKDATEMIETYNELKQRMEIEKYLKKRFKEGTALPVKFDGKGNFKEKTNTSISRRPVVKVHFDRTSADNEKGPGQVSHNYPPESLKSDTIFYPNKKKNY